MAGDINLNQQHPTPCKSCGACPTCGRGPAWGFIPQTPPWWYQPLPPWWSSGITVTSGTVTTHANLNEQLVLNRN